MLTPIRRVVTGMTAEDRSRVLYDGDASQVKGTLTEIWTTPPGHHDHHSTEDRGAASGSLEPPKGGTVCRFFEIPPESSLAHLSRSEREASWKALFAELNAPHAQPDVSRHPGMHLSLTTDYVVLLRGTITLVLDTDEVTLKPFDVVVQRATNHAWVNRGEENALLMAVLVDAKQPA